MTAITFNYNTDVLGTLFRLFVKVPFGGLKTAYKFYNNAKAENELYAMDDHLLADIGINRGEIHQKVWNK